MIHNLEEVKEMFKAADEIIQNNPQLLSMTTDEIFDELDDGTKAMIHNRWGVMTRVKMMDLKSLEFKEVIDFLATIKERNLLCEYIGYTLQFEKKLSLLELLIESYKAGQVNDVLPFVEHCIEYEGHCLSEKLDDILGIIENIEDGTTRHQLVAGYAILIVREKEEIKVLKKYIKDYSEVLAQLVTQVCIELYRKRIEDAEEWLNIYINEESLWCKEIAIIFLDRSIIYGSKTFERYFDILEQRFCDNELQWEKLIPVYVQYLLNPNEKLYINQVKKRLLSIKNGSINQKRIYLQTVQYSGIQSPDCVEVLEEIISVSFEKDFTILHGLDYYFKEQFEYDCEIAFEKLYRIFELNKFNDSEPFLECLHQTSIAMNHMQNNILLLWLNKILNGNKYEFMLSIDIFSKVISVENIEFILGEKELCHEKLLSLLEGVYLFTINEKKIVDLTFVIASYFKEKELFFEYCLENIYANYAGALLDAAREIVNEENEYKADLALRTIQYYELCKNKIQLGYEEKDFMPTTARRLTYQKSLIEQNKKINEKAEEKSIFADLFPSRKMKFGKRIAFVQTMQKGKMNYSISEYMTHQVSAELPKSFINEPMKYVYMRMKYLEKRDKNETDN